MTDADFQTMLRERDEIERQAEEERRAYRRMIEERKQIELRADPKATIRVLGLFHPLVSEVLYGIPPEAARQTMTGRDSRPGSPSRPGRQPATTGDLT